MHEFTVARSRTLVKISEKISFPAIMNAEEGLYIRYKHLEIKYVYVNDKIISKIKWILLSIKINKIVGNKWKKLITSIIIIYGNFFKLPFLWQRNVLKENVTCTPSNFIVF